MLSYLHNQQPAIIFRDLKPENIMRTSDGHIYLIDFGIARHFKPGQAKDTAYYGSMGYAPPEQYGKAQTTPRSDIYSLGATLHQLLSGHDPSSSPFRFPPLQSLVPTVSPTVAPTQLAKPNPGSSAAASLQSASSPAPQASKNPANGIPLSAGTLLFRYTGHSHNVLSAAWSPDGTRIASGSSDRVVQVWNADGSGEAFIYKGHSDEVLSVAWFPDGTRIASTSRDKSVQVWSAG